MFNKDTNLCNKDINNNLFKVVAIYILVNAISVTKYRIYININRKICYKINTTIVYILSFLKVLNRIVKILDKNKNKNYLYCFY